MAIDTQFGFQWGEEIVNEMEKVGIVPSVFPRPVGHITRIGSRKFEITGRATYEDFMLAVQAAGEDPDTFSQIPRTVHFLHIKRVP